MPLKLRILMVGFVLLLSCTPKLSDEQKQWKMTQHGDVFEYLTAQGKLKCEEDGYKLIRAYRVPARKSSNSIEHPTYDEVEWGWKVVLRNISKDNVKITVIYTLVDSDGFIVATDESDVRNMAPYDSLNLNPYSYAVIQQTSTAEYGKIIRATKSRMKINFYRF